MKHIFPIISVCLLILVILGGIFLWRPQFQQFREKTLRLQEKEVELEQKKEHYTKIADVYAQLSDYEEELAKIDSALPKELSTPTLLYFIQKKASENGLILEEIKMGRIISEQENEAGIQEVSFVVSVAGSYSAFKNFLTAVYNNAKLVEVDSISFGALREEESLFTFELSLSTNFYPKPRLKEVFPKGELPQLPELEY